MSDEAKSYAATPAATLEQHITDSNVAKNEAEWWAYHEIHRLREEIDTLKGINYSLSILANGIADGILEERERCAKVCEKIASEFRVYRDHYPNAEGCDACAIAIRKGEEP